MTTGQRMRERRKTIGLSAEKVAEMLHLSPATIYRYENGDIEKVPGDFLGPIAKVLNTTPAYLMGWEDAETGSPMPSNISPMPNMVKKPRLGAIACGKPILAVEETDEFDLVPDFVNCDFTLVCKGDSMINARIFDGDIVYIRSQPEVENGQIAAVRIDDEATLKKVYYTPGSDRITLRACNPLYPDMVYEGETLDHIQILGLAVGFYSTIRHEQQRE